MGRLCILLSKVANLSLPGPGAGPARPHPCAPHTPAPTTTSTCACPHQSERPGVGVGGSRTCLCGAPIQTAHGGIKNQNALPSVALTCPWHPPVAPPGWPRQHGQGRRKAGLCVHVWGGDSWATRGSLAVPPNLPTHCCWGVTVQGPGRPSHPKSIHPSWQVEAGQGVTQQDGQECVAQQKLHLALALRPALGRRPCREASAPREGTSTPGPAAPLRPRVPPAPGLPVTVAVLARPLCLHGAGLKCWVPGREGLGLARSSAPRAPI